MANGKDKKHTSLTNEEIVKAMRICYTSNRSCSECPFDRFEECTDVLMGVYAIDLVERLQAEIKVKNKLLAKAEAKIKAIQMDNEQLKSDVFNAITNCERLQDYINERWEE